MLTIVIALIAGGGNRNSVLARVGVRLGSCLRDIWFCCGSTDYRVDPSQKS